MMNRCEWVKDRTSLYLYDELSPQDRRTVEEHAAACADCAQALDAGGRFLELLEQRPETQVPEALLTGCRRDLMRAVRHGTGWRAAAAAWSAAFFDGLAGWRLVWQPAFAAALLAVGFYAGRGFETAPAASPAERGSAAAQAPRPGAAEAPRSNAGEARPPVAPVGAAGGAARPVELGDIRSIEFEPERELVRISVEEVHYLTIEGSPGEPEIRDLLIAAVREYPASGVRLETLEALATRSGDPAVREALLAAMLRDENPGVRLKALSALESHHEQPGVRQALVHVLRRDPNPGMRVKAVDLLTQNPDRNLVGVLQERVTVEANNYVRLKCGSTLRVLDASEAHY